MRPFAFPCKPQNHRSRRSGHKICCSEYTLYQPAGPQDSGRAGSGKAPPTRPTDDRAARAAATGRIPGKTVAELLRSRGGSLPMSGTFTCRSCARTGAAACSIWTCPNRILHPPCYWRRAWAKPGRVGGSQRMDSIGSWEPRAFLLPARVTYLRGRLGGLVSIVGKPSRVTLPARTEPRRAVESSRVDSSGRSPARAFWLRVRMAYERGKLGGSASTVGIRTAIARSLM